MRRKTSTLRMSDDEDFDSPESSPNQTSYNLEYSRSTRRIVNPNEPSTSRAAAAAAAGGSSRNFAVKSTSHSPYGRNAPERETRSNTRNLDTSAGEKARSRKQAKPKRRQRNRDLLFLREMRKLQKSDKFMIPKLPFGRLVREIIQKEGSGLVTHITRQALEAIQEATEMYVTQVLNDAYLLCIHRKRVTLSVEDIEILRVLRLVN